MKCKKAIGVFKSNSLIGSQSQLWKLNNKKRLKNKGFWSSNEEWSFRTKEDLVYIENISKTKVLGATSDGKVQVF